MKVKANIFQEDSDEGDCIDMDNFIIDNNGILGNTMNEKNAKEVFFLCMHI